MIFAKSKTKLNFPETIPINGVDFDIKVEFIKKKNSSVSIKGDILSFRLSSYLSAKQSEEHFTSLLKKISEKISKSKSIFETKKFGDVLEKGCFMFAGEIFTIEYAKIRGIKLKDNTFYLSPSTSHENAEKAFIKLLCLKYQERMENYVLALNIQTYNYKITGFSLKLVSSKWGHCTHDNKILLNLKLLNAPTEVMNYVIFHELSHIIHKNHSDKFWKEVARYCPNYKVLRKSLKSNPPQLWLDVK